MCFDAWRGSRYDDDDDEDERRRTGDVETETRTEDEAGRVDPQAFPELVTQQSVDRRYTQLVRMAMGDGRPDEVAEAAVGALEQEFRDARPGESLPPEITMLRRR